MDTLTALYAIGGWVMALIVEVVWYRQYKKMVAEWYEKCKRINARWYDLCMELIDEGADRIKGSKRLLKGKDEPQTDIHDLTDCDFCKDRNCKDCEGGKDEQSGKE